MPAVSIEIAEKDVNSWLNYKKLSDAKKEDKKDAIKKLVALIADGKLTLDPETFILKQELCWEVGETLKVGKLEYKPRINVGELQMNLRGVDVMEDMTGYMVAYGAALTGQPKNIIKLLDTEDFTVVQTIAGFFS